MSKKQVYYNMGTGMVVDFAGQHSGEYGQVVYGETAEIELHVISGVADGAVVPADLTDYTGFRGAIDSDFSAETTPMTEFGSDHVNASNAAAGVLVLSIPTETAAFKAAVDGAAGGKRQVTLDLYLYESIDGESRQTMTLRMPVMALMPIAPVTSGDDWVYVPDNAELSAARAARIDKLVISGDGAKFLADDGVYKAVDNASALAGYGLAVGDDGTLIVDTSELAGSGLSVFEDMLKVDTSSLAGEGLQVDGSGKLKIDESYNSSIISSIAADSNLAASVAVDCNLASNVSCNLAADSYFVGSVAYDVDLSNLANNIDMCNLSGSVEMLIVGDCNFLSNVSGSVASDCNFASNVSCNLAADCNFACNVACNIDIYTDLTSIAGSGLTAGYDGCNSQLALDFCNLVGCGLALENCSQIAVSLSGGVPLYDSSNAQQGSIAFDSSNNLVINVGSTTVTVSTDGVFINGSQVQVQ